MAFIRFRKKKDIPTGLWVKCENCEATLFKKELARNVHVCGECGHHFSMSGRERIRITVDRDSFLELSVELYALDRLAFVDKEPYTAKLAKSIKKTGQSDAAIYGTCTIAGHPAVLCVLDFTFIGGSMGTVVGEKVTRAIELATERRLPVIVVSASGGARMHEGALSLMQMAKTSCAIQRHHDQGGLYISVLTNPTTGGVTASFAALGDVTLAEPGALIGFAGPRVIKETLRTSLPDGFQRSEFLLEHGFIDRIVPRAELRQELARLLGYLWRYQEGERLAEGQWSPPEAPVDKEADSAAAADAQKS
jgi:acetyl-CoA carboxylase carboxyl transferase subunit beta